MRGRKSYVWTEERKRYLRDNAGQMTDNILAREMSRIFEHSFSIAAIRLKRRELGILKENGRGKCKVRTKSNQ